ncbi:MAG: quinone-dependent dihydroorotate dehydrogenase [Actinomycetota bacterium]|nr:quinone-dependent dihydroorotate dehydrogenase [Actinomycetota bacterium]
MTAYQLLFDRVLAHIDAERVHQHAFRAIRSAHPLTRLVRAAKASRPGANVQAMGLEFPGVLGLAAGFDKNAVGIDALAALGFGFVEVGTVTAEPQPGNPRPRLARLPADRAVVNRMGFNNDGAEVVARRLAERQERLRRTQEPGRRDLGARKRRVGGGVLVGVNIGKSKVVPPEQAVADYEKSTRLLAPYADYLVVNVSSPNTPGLRGLQSVDLLEPLLRAVRRCALDVSHRHVPLLVKIAPDLPDDDIRDVAELATSLRLDGIVATNTTLSRAGLRSPAEHVEAAGEGGLSGQPLRQRALHVLRLLRSCVDPEMTLVGVGGIASVEDARERLVAGADLLQGYTGFVYEGPLWPSRLNAALAKEPLPAESGGR